MTCDRSRDYNSKKDIISVTLDNLSATYLHALTQETAYHLQLPTHILVKGTAYYPEDKSNMRWRKAPLIRVQYPLGQAGNNVW